MYKYPLYSYGQIAVPYNTNSKLAFNLPYKISSKIIPS